MAQQERVLVKHSVTGRLLVSSTDGPTYTFDPQGELTVITICGVASDKGAAVVELKSELNVFRFEACGGAGYQALVLCRRQRCRLRRLFRMSNDSGPVRD